MPTTVTDLFTPLTSAQWLQVMLANAVTLNLPTTAWQEGTPELTILMIAADALANEDRISSLVAQGGFLDTAGNGSVTYLATNGSTVTSPVTPEGGPGWLDLLSYSQYDLTRIPASYAGGYLAFANTTAVASAAYAVGTYHAVNPATQAAYSNAASLTIAGVNIVGGTIIAATNASPIVVETSAAHGLANQDTVKIAGCTGNTAANGFFVVTVVDGTHLSLGSSAGNGAWVSGGTVNLCTVCAFSADISGSVGTSARGQITQTVTTLTGVTCYNALAFYGATVESNMSLVARCRLKLQSLSPGGPAAAAQYFALTSNTLAAPATLSVPINRTKKVTSPSTGVVTLTVASSAGVVLGITNLAVTAATNASPIAITTAAPHTLVTGNYVTLSGVLGNLGANGTFTINKTGASSFELIGGTGSGAYTGGGIVEGGDLGQVDKVVQANAVSDNTTLLTVSAIALNVAVVGTVIVPLAKVAEYTINVQLRLVDFFATILPIGGYAIIGTLPLNDVIGILYAAGQPAGLQSYVQNVSAVTLNGSASDVVFTTASHVAVLTPTPVITVVGI